MLLEKRVNSARHVRDLEPQYAGLAAPRPVSRSSRPSARPHRLVAQADADAVLAHDTRERSQVATMPPAVRGRVSCRPRMRYELVDDLLVGRLQIVLVLEQAPQRRRTTAASRWP